MQCSICESQNRPTANFCEGCGAELQRQCATCRGKISASGKFCPQCGAPTRAIDRESQPEREPRAYTPPHLVDKILNSRSALEGERKHVTVLFADIQGSMQLATQLDPEHWHDLLEDYFAILTSAVHRFEGSVNQYTGDGIMALFGAPIGHEDHAQRACYAALWARDKLRDFGNEQRVRRGLNFNFRIGLNSGDVVVGKIGDDLRMDYTAQGASVGVAQRIEQLATAGHVFVGSATERLVSGYFQMRSMGDVNVAGLADPLPMFELQAASDARSRLDVAAARGLSRFVGRSAELDTLNAALERAKRGHGQAIGVVGEPGLGKSRLCMEFVHQCRAQGLQVFEAHCPAHGKNIPYMPILELFRTYFDIELHDSALQSRQKVRTKLAALDASLQDSLEILFEFMGAPDPEQPAPALDAELKQLQLYNFVHRVSAAQDALGQLTVTLIDDMHWIDAGSDAFVEQIISACAGRRSLIVLNFRPEYEAKFANKQHYQQVPLVPLSDKPLHELISELLGRDVSVAELTKRISLWTDGNPFYAEELVNALIEDGHLVGRKGDLRLVTRVDQLTVPGSVRSVLAARIDRLPDAAKRLLQIASVIGREFSGSLLEAVSDLNPGEQVEAIGDLTTREFIHERSLYPIPEYAFQHPLTQEVAYESQLVRRRERVHAAVAQAVEVRAGDKIEEQAALIALHWERAGDVLEAAGWHRRAAEWSGVNDIKASLHHWLRVRELAKQSDDIAASSLLVAACSYGMMLGWRLGESALGWQSLFDEGVAAAQQSGDMSALAILNMNYSAVHGLNEGRTQDYLRYSSEAVRIADQTTQVSLRCATRLYLAYALAYAGELLRCERVTDKLIALADGDPDLGAIEAGLSPLISARHIRFHAIGCVRDVPGALHESAALREFALANNYRTQASWSAVSEAEVAYRAGFVERTREAANAAREAGKDTGISVNIMVVCAECNAFAAEGDWQVVLDMATATLQEIRETGAMRLWEPYFLAHIANAHLATGAPEAARAAGAEGLAHMHATDSAFTPCCYPVLARAQLALNEPTAEIAKTLDAFESFINRFEFRIYYGALCELRASLAGREKHSGEGDKYLVEALGCYRELGMTSHAERVDGLLAS